MRGLFVIIALLFISLVSPLHGQSVFPEDYLGQWEGQLLIYSGNRLVKEVTMRLLIDETASEDIFIYNMVYQGKGEEPDARNYLLIVKDLKNGVFEIDEQNSIVLPMQLFGTKLVSSFTVEGSVVHFMYELGNNTIGVEVLSGPYEEATFTGEQMGVPQVGIINNQIFQVGVLKRK
jgi:hypothetical protein